MTAISLPEPFVRSYEAFLSYPQNLMYPSVYRRTLHAYTTRLDSAAAKLFVQSDAQIEVPFRDFSLAGELVKQNIFGDRELREWLGDQSHIDPQTSGSGGDIATKSDPQCRFIFIWAGHSRHALRINRTMLVRIFSYHQVMAGYLDFVFVFGSQSEPRDLRFSSFHEQSLLAYPPRGPAVPDLGRTGRQYQLCYNLKAVASIPSADDPTKRAWTIRQAAFHHQFDVVKGTTLWIVTKGDKELKERVQELTDEHGRPEHRAFGTPADCFRSSLAVHLMYCHWSTEEWRWYVEWLENSIDQGTQLIIAGPRERSALRIKYRPEDLQDLQGYKDKANEAIMVLEANNDVLTAICKFYESLVDHPNFPLRAACRQDITTFAVQLNEMIYDVKMRIRHANLLVQIAEDRKSLLTQHLQNQGAEKMEILTVNMHQIGVMAQKEAIAMRIITVVTLIYLPATFVSTFFSTDVIKYQNQGTDGSFSKTALLRWLEVTLPLTLITLSLGYFCFVRANRRREKLPFFSVEPK